MKMKKREMNWDNHKKKKLWALNTKIMHTWARWNRKLKMELMGLMQINVGPKGENESLKPAT